MSGDVYVVGIDMIPFGRFPDRTVPDMAAEASLLALDDAGLSINDIEALYCGNLLRSMEMVGQRLLKEIGMTGIPVSNVTNACATGATAFRDGVIAIKSGMVDLVLAVGVEQLGKGLLGGGGSGQFNREGEFGSTTNPCMFAEIGMEYAARYGTTFEQFAKVAVKNHYHATFNPKAMYRKETPLEEVMASEMISYPNTKLMCSANVDGAAAAVLASEKTVFRLGLGDRAVRVKASVLTSSPYTQFGLTKSDFNEATRFAARQAYDQAGISPDDLDLIELHDCFATAELCHYDNLGICAEGEAGPLIDSGATELGGRIPVNVSGGLLSKGHPLGATGIANIYEVATHLRDKAGKRQVDGARLGLTHVCGGAPDTGAACAIHILERT